jgi:flavin reductase (DIM6/NTAB) family NADH-FMN oxidoreductase RutF
VNATPEAFVAAMRLLPAGVTIVTSGPVGRRNGFTATAVCSVAADPPHLLVCANRGMETHGTILETGHFAVNVLSLGQEALADRFGGRLGIDGEARFQAADWHTLASGAPILASACAAFDCRVTQRLTVATHDVIIGRVLAATDREAAAPLAYLDRDYAFCVPAGGRY